MDRAHEGLLKCIWTCLVGPLKKIRKKTGGDCHEIVQGWQALLI